MEAPVAVPAPARSTGRRGGLAPAFARAEQDTIDWATTGSWASGSLTRASGGTFTQSNAAGDTAQFTFTGTWVSLGFVGDRLSGEVEITIDGTSQGTFDLYRREVSSLRMRFDGLTSGVHSIGLTVTGTANPFAANSLVKLDYADSGDGSLLPDGDFEETDPRLLISDGWSTTSYAGASGGTYLRSGTGTAWFPFFGDSFSLHALAHNNAGRVRLYVDGQLLEIVDLYEPVSSTVAQTRVFSYEGIGPGHHVLQIVAYQDDAIIDRITTPGSAPFIDPNAPVIGVTRFETDHPSLRYNGGPLTRASQDWSTTANITSTRASAGEVVISGTTGDEVAFDFDGEWLGVGFLTDRSGGQAEIAIDGVVVETLDLYTRYTDTLSRYYRNLGPGPHTATITALGTASPASNSTRVALDYFEAWDGLPLAEGAFEEDDDRVIIGRGWSRTAAVDASGGAFLQTGIGFGNTAWFAFSGDSVAWQGWSGLSFQDVDLRIDGVSVAVKDLYSQAAGPRAFSFTGFGPGPHVLEISQVRNEASSVDVITTPATGPADPPPPMPEIVRYEENHPSIRYNGQPYRTMPQTWSEGAFLQASRGYHASSSTPDDRMQLDFEGQWVALGFRSSATSGTVEVLIDGVSQGVFDTSAGVNESKTFTFGGLAPGAHTVEAVVVSGALMPDFIDVWTGQAVADGWYEAELDAAPPGLLHLSFRRWWIEDGDEYANEGDYLRPFSSADTNAWFNFSGTGVTVLAYERDSTALQVVIDGVDQGVFDLSPTAPFRVQPVALHFTGLSEGAHTVQVALDSTGSVTPRLDAFEVDPSDTLSYTPNVEWFDTTGTETLPGRTGTGFLSTIAVGDINGDGVVELVAPGHNGRLYVYRGDGQDAGGGSPILWTSDLAGPAAEPALADLDGDGLAEIIVSGRDGTYAFHHDGQVLWSNPGVVSYFAGQELAWSGPSVGNLDLDPEPEIVISSIDDALYVLDHQGNVVFSDPLGSDFPTVPVLADITGDGVLDIVVAQEWTLKAIDVFNGGVLAWSRDLPDPILTLGGAGSFGSPAVADLDADGRPEIIINWGHVIEALQDDGTLLWRYETNNSNLFRPSPVTVADVTGDGQPNLVTASAISQGLTVANHRLMVLDAAGSLVWEQNVADNSASASGVAAQDLTGNGAWEIIWNGATDGFLIINGPDGRRLYNEPYTGSGTVLDYPTLADVDGDGEAEIITAGRNGLFVIGHPGRWVDSRPVWNQHNYHIDNVNNDWSVPFTQANSWETHNTYRTQTPERDPGCLVENGIPVGPSFVELSPASGEVLPADVGFVISGRVLPVSQSQPVLQVEINGIPADRLDSSGSFFSLLELEPGLNSIELRAMDRCAERLLALELNGGGNDTDPWADLADASVLFEARFSATTHDPASERLLTRVQAFNAGPSVAGPVLMTIGGDAAPSIGLLNADGVTPQGESYVIVVPDGEVLEADALSAVRDLALSNRQRAPIDFTPRWIAPVNQPPYFSSIPSLRAVVGEAWRYPTDVADGNGDHITLSLTTVPAGMTVVDHELIWTPSSVGSVDVVVEAGDGRGGSTRQGFTLQVSDGSFNSPPVFTTTPSVQIPVGGSYSYAAQASDLDGDVLSYSLLAAPAGVLVDSASGLVTWPQARIGQQSLVLQTDDGRGGQATQAWTLYVGERAATDPGPAFSSVPSTFAAVGVEYRYVFRVNSFGAQPATVSLVQGPSTMSIDPVGKVLTWVPSSADLGSQVVELRAVDASGQEATQRFDLQVLQELPNLPPYFVSSAPKNARTGSPYSYQAAAIDPEFDEISWSLTTSPSGMTVDALTGLVSWLPVSSTPAQVPVTLQASDPQGGVGVQEFQILLRDSNVPPVIATSAPGSALVGEFYSVRFLADDPDGDPLTWRLLAGPSGMTLHPSLGWLHWTTTGVSPGSYPVTIEVTDDWGGRDELSFVVDLQADIVPPEVAIAQLQAQACRAEPVTICVEAIDNVGLSSVTLEIDNQPRPLDSLRCHSWTPPEAVLIPALATAIDPSGQIGQASSSLTVVDCNDEQKPVVTLISPGPEALLLEPTPLIASIDDNTPSTMTWTATIRAGLDGDPEELAAGNGAVDQSEIAVIDPTRLVEGEYWVSILGNDGAQTGGIEFRVNVGSGFKPGRMVSSNVDASLPLAGIPLTVGRSYDSLEAGQPGSTPGDLGPGWRSSLSGSVQDSAREGSGPLADLLAEPFNSSTRVTVVKPNGERVGFGFVREPKPFPDTFDFEPVFEPDPGVRDELRAVDGVTAGLGIIPYNPSIYELETPDKVVYVFSETDGLIQVRDALGGTLDISEDGIQSSRGTSVDYVRDGQGRISEVVLPPVEQGAERGRIFYSYDAIGNLRTVTDLTGGVTTFEYADSAYPHHLTSVIDPRGEVMSHQVFDDEGRLVARCPADGNAATLEGCTTYEFDVAGGIETIFDTRGFRSDLIHDEQGQLLLRRDWVDGINYIEQQWTYDDTGRILEYRDGDGGVEVSEYDEQGNRIRRVMPDGQTWTWEYGACREQWIRQCDPLGNCHQREFNSNCRQTRVIDPLDFVTEYEYDGAGLLTRITDELGQDRQFAYDPFGQVTLITDASAQTTSFEYNGLGQITRSTDRNGQVREYVYDDTQRLVEERLPGIGSVAAYEYNATGLLTRMATTDSILETQYWPTGTVRRVDHSGPGAPDWWVEYDYDGNGNIEVVRDSAGGLTEYLYDGINRLVSVRQSGTNVLPKRVDIQSTAHGLPLMMRRFGDLDAQLPGPVTEYSYSCLSCPGRVTAIEHRQPAGAVIQRIDYQRDAAQRIVGMQDDDGLHQFVLDGRGWLIESIHPPASGNASGPTLWDATGNWLSRPGQSGAVQLSYAQGQGGHRLLADDVYDYSYTNEGQWLEREHRSDGSVLELTHSPFHRIESAELRDSGGQILDQASYVHASNGWRVSAERGGQERHYLHDFDNPMLALDESGNVVWRRLLNRFVDRPLAIERDGQLRWLLTDNLGTVRKEVDNGSQMLAEYRYDPFGQQVDGPVPSLDDPLRFTGRDFDLPGGLGYYRARVYDPGSARFVSEDPMMPWHYRYAENNPLIFVDPTGETAALEYGIILCDLSSIVGTVAPIMVGFAEVMAAAAEGLQGVPPKPGVGSILGPPTTPQDFAFQVFIPCGIPGIYNAATN